jgi:Tfp pilus assembly PilM family ATPase/Tfp pilus assembly protein PilN
MAIFQSSLGVDLRKDRIVFSSLRKSFNQVWVNTSQAFFLLSGEKPKEERETEIINLIQGFISAQGLSKDNVTLALPRESALVKVVELPSAAKENLRKVLEYELGKYIPFSSEDALFDFQILEEKENILRVMLVIMRKEVLNEHLDLFKRVGISPHAVEISSTGAVNLFYYDQHPSPQGSLALVDVEKQSFEFYFFEEGIFKEDLHGSFIRDEERAKELSDAYRLAVMKGLGPKDEKQSLFVFGEEAHETLVEKLRPEVTGDIQLAQSFRRVQMSNGLQNLRVSYPSIGLALRGLTKTRWNINLLPLNLRKKVTRVGLYLALCLCAVAVVLALTWMIHPLLQERKELEYVLAELKEKKPRVDAIEAVQKNKDLLEKEVREFGTLKGEETSKLEILRELSDILPSSVWIWNMKLRPKDIEINGFAGSASDLIAILDKSPFFEKVEFSSPVTKERRPTGDPAERERFRISAKIERTK